jgi:hypothetical protein
MADVSDAGEVRLSRWRERRESSERLRQAAVVLCCIVEREEVRSWMREEEGDVRVVMVAFIYVFGNLICVQLDVSTSVDGYELWLPSNLFCDVDHEPNRQLY